MGNSPLSDANWSKLDPVYQAGIFIAFIVGILTLPFTVYIAIYIIAGSLFLLFSPFIYLYDHLHPDQVPIVKKVMEKEMKQLGPTEVLKQVKQAVKDTAAKFEGPSARNHSGYEKLKEKEELPKAAIEAAIPKTKKEKKKREEKRAVPIIITPKGQIYIPLVLALLIPLVIMGITLAVVWSQNPDFLKSNDNLAGIIVVCVVPSVALFLGVGVRRFILDKP